MIYIAAPQALMSALPKRHQTVKSFSASCAAEGNMGPLRLTGT